MKLLVVLSLAWCCSAAQYVMPLSYMGYPFGQQYGSRDMYGYSTFGYHGINQNRHEFRHPDGRVVGHYSYIQPDGKPAVTFYEAGAGQGYRVRSNVLPVAETAELSAPVDNLVAPEPVQETPEVLQARAEFQAAFDEAKSRPVEEPSARKKRQVTFLTYPVTSAVNVKTGEDDKTTAIQVPTPMVYSYPFSPLTNYASFPYAYHGYPYYINPFVPKTEEVKAEPKPEAEAVVEARRRRREAQYVFPLKYTADYAKFKTQEFEKIESDTPADTTKIELKEKEYKFPSMYYPYSAYTPYSAFTPYGFNPAIPYSAPFPFPLIPAPVKKE